MDQEGFQSRDFVLYYKQNSQPFCFIRLYPGWNSLIVRSTVTSGDHSHLGTVQPPRYVTVDDKMHVFHDINPIRNKSNLFRKQGLSPLLRAPGDGMVHSQSGQFLCHSQHDFIRKNKFVTFLFRWVPKSSIQRGRIGSFIKLGKRSVSRISIFEFLYSSSLTLV